MTINNLITSVVNTYRWPLLGVACLLLNSCNPNTEVSKPANNTAETDLKPDRRYYDTMAIGPPYSESAKRQIAIIRQLRRLEFYKYTSRDRDSTKNNKPVSLIDQGKDVTFNNNEAWLRDIHTKMDSLKVLENIPLKPYPKIN